MVDGVITENVSGVCGAQRRLQRQQCTDQRSSAHVTKKTASACSADISCYMNSWPSSYWVRGLMKFLGRAADIGRFVCFPSRTVVFLVVIATPGGG